MEDSSDTIKQLVRRCRETDSVDEQVEILRNLNALLPLSKKVPLQSMFTNDYVEKVLSQIESSEANA